MSDGIIAGSSLTLYDSRPVEEVMTRRAEAATVETSRGRGMSLPSSNRCIQTILLAALAYSHRKPLLKGAKVTCLKANISVLNFLIKFLTGARNSSFNSLARLTPPKGKASLLSRFMNLIWRNKGTSLVLGFLAYACAKKYFFTEKKPELVVAKAEAFPLVIDVQPSFSVKEGMKGEATGAAIPVSVALTRETSQEQLMRLLGVEDDAHSLNDEDDAHSLDGEDSTELSSTTVGASSLDELLFGDGLNEGEVLLLDEELMQAPKVVVMDTARERERAAREREILLESNWGEVKLAAPLLSAFDSFFKDEETGEFKRGYQELILSKDVGSLLELAIQFRKTKLKRQLKEKCISLVMQELQKNELTDRFLGSWYGEGLLKTQARRLEDALFSNFSVERFDEVVSNAFDLSDVDSLPFIDLAVPRMGATENGLEYRHRLKVSLKKQLSEILDNPKALFKTYLSQSDEPARLAIFSLLKESILESRAFLSLKNEIKSCAIKRIERDIETFVSGGFSSSSPKE